MDFEKLYLELWNKYQDLIKIFSEQSWKIKSICISVWMALIAYGFQNSTRVLYLLSVPMIIIFLIVDSRPKILEIKYVNKSLEVEVLINKFMLNGKCTELEVAFTTNTPTINREDYKILLTFDQWYFWAPYISMIVISTGLFLFNFTNSK